MSRGNRWEPIGWLTRIIQQLHLGLTAVNDLIDTNVQSPQRSLMALRMEHANLNALIDDPRDTHLLCGYSHSLKLNHPHISNSGKVLYLSCIISISQSHAC